MEHQAPSLAQRREPDRAGPIRTGGASSPLYPHTFPRAGRFPHLRCESGRHGPAPSPARMTATGVRTPTRIEGTDGRTPARMETTGGRAPARLTVRDVGLTHDGSRLPFSRGDAARQIPAYGRTPDRLPHHLRDVRDAAPRGSEGDGGPLDEPSRRPDHRRRPGVVGDGAEEAEVRAGDPHARADAARGIRDAGDLCARRLALPHRRGGGRTTCTRC